MLFFICSDSGMTGADVRVGNYRYLLNQQTLINKLFEYYDNVFFVEKVEVDQRGYMGTHYDGLNLDYYLEDSILGIDYLSIEDYFETVANVKYVETESLFNQYSKLCIFSDKVCNFYIQVPSSLFRYSVGAYPFCLRNSLLKYNWFS